jgi:hypothetical protein
MNPTTISMLGHEHEADLAREARRAALAEVARHAPASGKPAVNLSPTFPARRLVVIALSAAATLFLALATLIH